MVDSNHPAQQGDRSPYLSLSRLLDLLLLPPLHLLEHLLLHHLFGLLHAPQHLRLNLVLPPLQLLGHSLRNELLDAPVGRVLDRLLLGLLLAP